MSRRNINVKNYASRLHLSGGKLPSTVEVEFRPIHEETTEKSDHSDDSSEEDNRRSEYTDSSEEDNNGCSPQRLFCESRS